MYQDNALEYVEELLDELEKQSAKVVIEKHFKDHLSKRLKVEGYGFYTETEGLDSSFDMFVSFGGDGTILRATTFVRDLGIPIVGVNTGRLGFLSTFKKEDVRKVVQAFLQGEYSIVERSLVEVKAGVQDEEIGELNFALNEIAVSRKDTTSMITIETHLN